MGRNVLEVSTSGSAFSVQIPTGNRLYVRKGDVIGLRGKATGVATVPYTSCDSSHTSYKFVSDQTATLGDIRDVTLQPIRCRVYSIRAKIIAVPGMPPFNINNIFLYTILFNIIIIIIIINIIQCLYNSAMI